MVEIIHTMSYHIRSTSLSFIDKERKINLKLTYQDHSISKRCNLLFFKWMGFACVRPRLASSLPPMTPFYCRQFLSITMDNRNSDLQYTKLFARRGFELINNASFDSIEASPQIIRHFWHQKGTGINGRLFQGDTSVKTPVTITFRIFESLMTSMCHPVQLFAL